MKNTGDKTQNGKRISPMRIFVITVLGVFIAEVIAMVVINRLGWLHFAWQTILDALIMVALILPVLYFSSYKFLLGQIADQERAESDLRRLHTELEQRIEVRTADLVQANETLKTEIAERHRITEELRKAHDELELRVQERTAELAQVNQILLAEIIERGHTLERLHLQSSALEAASNGIIITGRRGNIRWANTAFAKMVGYSLKEVLGQNPRLLKSGLHSDGFYQDMWKTILSGKVWQGETINRRKDGSLYTEEQTITPLVDEKGEITHFIAIKQDITERKQAEQALRQSEKLLQKVLETLPIGVWITDASGNLVQGNPESQRIWEGARFVGIDQYGEYKGWWLDSGERIEPEQWAAARAVTRGETSLNEEVEIECFDGSHKIIFNSAVPILDERNVVQGVIVVNQDITERKQAEESLQLERLKLRNILDTMPEGVCIVGQKYDIEYINPGLEREFGPVGKRKCYDYFNNRTEVCDWCMNERVFAGESFTWEWYSSKTAKSYDLFDTPIVNPNGSISKLEIFHDITERKRAEEQLAHQNKELLDLTNTERKQREIIETVCAAAQSLTQSLKLENVVNTLLEYIDQIIPYDTASVAVLEEEARLAVRAVRGNEHWTNFSTLLVEEYPTNSIAQKLLSSRQSLLIPDLAGHPDWKMNAEAAYIRSWLGVPIVSGEKAFGVVWLGKCEAEFFTPEHAQWAEAMVDQAGVAIQNAWLFEQVQSNSERLQYLSHRLVDTQENELRYIAQELHDEVGQAITSLMVGLQRIQEEADKPEVIRAESARLDQVIDNVMENLHRLAMDLRPASLDRLGLMAALDQHIEILREKLGLNIQFEMIGVDERLPANLEIALFRIVQEALNNVARHAQATQADVLLHKRNCSLVLIIEDNGAGFDPEVATKGDRLGLVGMRERAEMLGGKLIIESAAGAGTTILVEVPYADSNSPRG